MNQLPAVLEAIVSTLSAVSVVAALGCFVLAGLRLRAEGGVNYDAGGGFFKWMFWGAVFLTLPGLTAWLSLHNIHTQAIVVGSSRSITWIQPFQAVLEAFMDEIVIQRIVPVLAATLVVKAVLDTAEGHSPLPSLIGSLFLLGIKGLYALATGYWMTTDAYATPAMLQSMFLYLATVICPLIGGLCISGAIICFIRNRGWGHLVATGLAFLSIPGLWALVKAMAGVSLNW